MRFPARRIIGVNVDGFHRAEGSEGRGGASFDARDREPFGGISHAEDVTFDEGVLGEKPECPPQQGSKTNFRQQCFDVIRRENYLASTA